MKYVTIKRSGLVLFGLICLIVGSCLSCGCMIDAGKLAGFSAPKLDMTYDGARGRFDLEAGTDFQGRAEGHYNPETKQIDAEIEVGSGVSPVVKAEGERAESLVELRKIEAEMLVRMHEIVGENIKAVGSTAAKVADAVANVRNSGGGSSIGSSLVSGLWTFVKVCLVLIVLGILIPVVWALGTRLWGKLSPRN